MYSVPLGTGGPIRQNNCSLLCRQGEEDNEGKYNFIKYRMLQVRKLKYDAWNIMFGFKKKEATDAFLKLMNHINNDNILQQQKTEIEGFFK